MGKLAIVCGGPSSELLAPFDDKNYEIWVLGNRANKYPRFDCIFEIHDNLSEHGNVNAYVEWLLSLNVPLVVGEQFPISENVEIFPYTETVALYGSLYLTSSPACMLAYAILKGYQHIEIYGVDMAVDDIEYFWQRPCMEAWVGFAKGKGINVVIPEVSPFGKAGYVEGRDHGKDRPKMSFPANQYAEMVEEHKTKITKLAERYRELEAAKEEMTQLERAINAHYGASQVYERMAQIQRAIESGNDIKTLQDTVSMR